MVVQRVTYNNQNDQLYATQDHYIDTQRQWQMAMAAAAAAGTATASTKRNK